MADHVEARAELICGRMFTHQELQEIQDTIRLFPKLSQTELAKPSVKCCHGLSRMENIN